MSPATFLQNCGKQLADLSISELELNYVQNYSKVVFKIKLLKKKSQYHAFVCSFHNFPVNHLRLLWLS